MPRYDGPQTRRSARTVVVHHYVPPAHGIPEQALPARRVDVVVRAEGERARRRVEIERDVVTELPGERARGARVAPDKHFVLLACGWARDGLCEDVNIC